MKQTVKKLALLAMSFFVATLTFAQITTSSLSGRVTEATGDAVPGATVIAVHTPSGTQYYAITDNAGNYRIHNMRVGGPYTVTVSFVGYADAVYGNITLRLSENYVQNIVISETATTLEAIVISAGVQNTILSSDKAGTSTNVNAREINALPTVSRGIQDFTKLTPQASGFSFAGRDNRMNNFTVDGAGFNNNFGLSSDLPGGKAQPISLDAIEEISVNIAPYDIRQTRFTGAAINAVTKSGTNRFSASAYTYQRFKSMTGNTVDGNEVQGANETNNQTYGFRVGGPIIKNKLFFFLSAEYETQDAAGVTWRPSTDGTGDASKGISRTSEADLERVKQHLINNYNYDPGKYKDWDPFKVQNYKILARIDWNINKHHKLMIRYNDVVGSYMNVTNATSAPSGLNRASSARMSANSIAFSNNFYGMENTVRSITGELNSNFSSNVSNQFYATYTHIRDGRTSDSDLFPHVDIWKDGDAYMSFGYELFSFHNEVLNNTWNIVDNLTINLNRHTVTIGASFERLFVKNSYIREGTSYYRYASVDDFLNNATPIAFGLTYGYNGEDAPGQTLTFGYGGLYAQDEWQVTPRFKLTYGVRLEMPFYFDDMLTNNAITQQTANFTEIKNDSGIDVKGGSWDVGTWPKSKVTINPRIGFNWDVKGDRSLQLRGGTGIFSGMMPFVWFTNQVGGAAMIQSPELAWNTATCAAYGLKFTPNYKNLIASDPSTFPTSPNANYLPNNASIAMVDKDFDFPQVWRSNLAVDIELPWNMIFTGEALFTKDINAVTQVNANEPVPTGTMAGADNRPVWVNRKINSALSSAMVLTNTNKGYQWQLTAQLTKNFSKGLSGMIAYTYSVAKDVSANPGSTAYSVWTANSSVNSLNNPGLSYSSFSIPHRLVGNLTYRIEYANHLATSLGVVYQGMPTGRWSYTYSGDVNGDGSSGSDLMYIPASPGEITFVAASGMTPEQQSTAFFKYIDDNEYLSARKGQYAERFGHVQPWIHRFDVKVLQDLFVNFGKSNRLTLQVSLDVLNVGNLLNDSWGCYYYNAFASYDNVMPVTVVGKGTTTSAPTFKLNATSIENFEEKSVLTKSISTSSTWSMLLGFRLLF
jgi:hypothetical protein